MGQNAFLALTGTRSSSRLRPRAQDTASEQQLPPDATQLEPKTAKHPHRHLSRKEIIVKAVCSVVFVLLGGVFSGLSLGLMVLAASGPPKDRKDAQRVLGLLSHGRHFVLVCLLLSNVIVNETLPVFLDSLTGGGGLIAVLISSASIVIFGEILPQALCSQHGLRIGARCTGFVKALMIVEAPVCWPTAKLLDLLLGSHTTHYYRREELGALVDLHATSGAMSQVESELVGGVLRLQGQRVEECMRKDVYTVGDMVRVCDVDLKKLLASGQTYIPVLHTSLDYEKELVSALANPNECAPSAFEWTTSESIAYLKQEDPSAVLLVVEQLSESTTRPVGFATLEDLARVIVMPNPAAEVGSFPAHGGSMFPLTVPLLPRLEFGPLRSAQQPEARSLVRPVPALQLDSGASYRVSLTVTSRTAPRLRNSRSASRPLQMMTCPCRGRGRPTARAKISVSPCWQTLRQSSEAGPSGSHS
ncbi:hypothetical protein C6P46_002553 [Rhodotorula mucilaginosa]|uniref:CNNM transmembrane domain-containing protein n=1 Tax=Rhodotorula mucilaginosa TaxID=5537 RepID=A0A9P6W7W0_RHOMI|nr:hypothetical protein C6P46_002553 [Rhodotorula mucilaginosa]